MASLRTHVFPQDLQKLCRQKRPGALHLHGALVLAGGSSSSFFFGRVFCFSSFLEGSFFLEGSLLFLEGSFWKGFLEGFFFFFWKGSSLLSFDSPFSSPIVQPLEATFLQVFGPLFDEKDR